MNLVLHHGLFGFATLGPLVYFNGLRDHLMSKFQGLRVLVTQVAPDGKIEVRGAELGKQIADAIRPGGALDPGNAVHIIAHSAGGLDARFLLSPANQSNMADRVVSLTTIGTPHHGSPIADILVAIEKGVAVKDEKILEQPLRKALDLAKIPVDGLRDVTTEGSRRFNAQFPDNAGTKKFSVAGVGRRIQLGLIHLDTCLVLGLPHRIIRDRTGEDNDGLVSLNSATWANGPELWQADHADEIGHDLDLGVSARPKFDYLAKYDALVDRLRNL